jgi:RNA polymerase sigma factor (sigma-70 family)
VPTAIITALALLLSPQRPHSDPGWRQAQREHATDVADLERLAGADPAPSPEDQAADAEVFERVHVALAALSADERQVIEARYMRGLTVREVAAELDRPRMTIWRTERAALARLRVALADLRD